MPRMLSRSDWIAEFIGHVVRRGLSDDPDWVFEVANESYSEFADLDPDFAADSAFSPEELGGQCSAARRSISS